MRINELSIGMCASATAIASYEINEKIAELSGDYNPIHFSDKAARQSGFEGVIAHALFCEGLVSRVIAQQLPGPGAIIISQSVFCKYPVYMGDVITANLTIQSIDYTKNRIVIEAKCINNYGKTVMLISLHLLMRE